MGLSINEVEQWAKENKATIIADEWWDAAQNIIKKYRGIEQIIKDWNDSAGSAEEVDVLNDIEKVVEDENVTN